MQPADGALYGGVTRLATARIERLTYEKSERHAAGEAAKADQPLAERKSREAHHSDAQIPAFPAARPALPPN